MGAAAELARPVAETDDSHDVAVLLLEQVHGALRDRLLVWLLALVEWQRLADLLHDAAVDAAELVSGHGAVQRDVECRVVGADPRSFLNHALAEDLTQRPVQQMGGGVMAHDLAPSLLVDRRSRLLAGHDVAGDDSPDVRDDAIGGFLSVVDAEAPAGRDDEAGVADLTAGLRVERRALEKHLDLFSLAGSFDH